MTTIQSFSTTIFEPTEAIWARAAKMMVTIGVASGIQSGQTSSPTLPKYNPRKTQLRAVVRFCTAKKNFAAVSLGVLSIQLPMEAPKMITEMLKTSP